MRTGTEPIYRNHLLCGDRLRRGWFLFALRRREWGSAVGRRKLYRGLVFPSQGGCLRANINDGANIRSRPEAPVIVRFG